MNKKICCGILVFILSVSLVYSLQNSDMDEFINSIKKDPAKAAQDKSLLEKYMQSQDIDIAFKGDVAKYDINKGVLELKDGSTFEIKTLSEFYSFEVKQDGSMLISQKSSKNKFIIAGKDIKYEDGLKGKITHLNEMEFSRAQGNIVLAGDWAIIDFKEPVTINKIGNQKVHISGDSINYDMDGKILQFSGQLDFEKGQIFGETGTIVNGVKLTKKSNIVPTLAGELPQIALSETLALQDTSVELSKGNKYTILKVDISTQGEMATAQPQSDKNKWQDLYDTQQEINNEWKNNKNSARMGELVKKRNAIKAKLDVKSRLSSSEILRKRDQATVTISQGKVDTGKLKVQIKKPAGNAAIWEDLLDVQKKINAGQDIDAMVFKREQLKKELGISGSISSSKIREGLSKAKGAVTIQRQDLKRTKTQPPGANIAINTPSLKVKIKEDGSLATNSMRISINDESESEDENDVLDNPKTDYRRRTHQALESWGNDVRNELKNDGYNVIDKPARSNNHGSSSTDKTAIMFHSGGGLTKEGDLRTLTKGSEGSSANYYVDKQGRIYELVPPNQRAHHAGGANNGWTIGIETESTARDKNGGYAYRRKGIRTKDYDEWSQKQKTAITALVNSLKKTNPSIGLITTHSARSSVGKSDPGIANTAWLKDNFQEFTATPAKVALYKRESNKNAT